MTSQGFRGEEYINTDMIQPVEMKAELPMIISNGVVSTTTKVWEMLTASRDGNLEKLKQLERECPGLVYAQYNYTPPIHFAVREGRLPLVQYLLDEGALDPKYITYPFGDTLLTVATDRGYDEIALLLQDYLAHPERTKFTGDNGEILYGKSEEQQVFQKAVNKGAFDIVKQMLDEHPEYALDETVFWGEGVIMMPANMNNIQLIELLMQYGAKVPPISKWGRAYYFKHDKTATYLMQHGMDPNHMSWHHVTLLHDMAQCGDLEKAKLLLKHGATINPLEEEYRSTPLGLAARWGHKPMVAFLLEQGADPNKAGAAWSTPLAWARKKGHKAVEKLLLEASGE